MSLHCFCHPGQPPPSSSTSPSFYSASGDPCCSFDQGIWLVGTSPPPMSFLRSKQLQSDAHHHLHSSSHLPLFSISSPDGFTPCLPQSILTGSRHSDAREDEYSVCPSCSATIFHLLCSPSMIFSRCCSSSAGYTRD